LGNMPPPAPGQWGLGNIGQSQQPNPFAGFIGGGMNWMGGAGLLGGAPLNNLGGMPMMGGGLGMGGGQLGGFNQTGGQYGQQGGWGYGMNRYQQNRPDAGFFLNTQQRLTYEE